MAANAVSDADRARRFLALIEQVAGRLFAASDTAGMVADLFRLIETELQLDVFFCYRCVGDRLELVASAGLTGAEAAAGAALEIGEAVCGAVARDPTPLHATAIRSSREPHLAFLRAVGLDAHACTPLMQGDRLLGTLGFGRRRADRFAADELRFIQTICHLVALAGHRLQVEEDLRHALAAKDHLLQELNHRVRNSLQLVLGILSLEERDVAGADARAALAHARDRILVIATAHRRLYDDPGLTGLDVAGLLKDLTDDLTRSTGVAIRLRADRAIVLPVEMAVSLALAVDHLMRRHFMADAATRPAPIAIDIITGADGATHVRFTDHAGRPPTDPAPDRVLTAMLRQLRAALVPVAGALPALDLVMPSDIGRA